MTAFHFTPEMADEANVWLADSATYGASIAWWVGIMGVQGAQVGIVGDGTLIFRVHWASNPPDK